MTREKKLGEDQGGVALGRFLNADALWTSQGEPQGKLWIVMSASHIYLCTHSHFWAVIAKHVVTGLDIFWLKVSNSSSFQFAHIFFSFYF